MKAAQINEYGDPSVLVLNKNVPKPAAGKGQVVVEVYASSVNPFESKVRAGVMKDAMPLEFPATLGGDIAGVVSEVGEGVEGFKAGDRVYGQAAIFGGGSGAFAEYAAAKAVQVAHMPADLDFNQAAALPLTGVSALQAVTEHIALQSGQKILIQGGSGGIGSVAIQIAKHLGAYVATTVPTDAVDYAKELGADEVIDFKTQKFEELIRDYDAVFDTAGGEVFEKSIDVLRSGAVAVSMVAQPDEAHAKQRGVTALTQHTQVTTERLDALRKLVEDGVVKVRIHKVFPLDHIAEAFATYEGGGVRGKIVIQVK